MGPEPARLLDAVLQFLNPSLSFMAVSAFYTLPAPSCPTEEIEAS